MLRRTILTAAALLFAATTANASVLASPQPAGTNTAVGFNFASQPNGVGPLVITNPFIINGITFDNIVGTVEISNSSDGTGAQPFQTNGAYLSILANSSITVSFSARSSLGFFWGSIDPGNRISFNDADKTVIRGSDLLTLGLNDNGCQEDTACNRFINFTSNNSFTSFTLFSEQNSFEVTNFVTPAVPEASTWAMMLLGFVGVGGMAYRRRKTGRSLRIV